MFRTLHTISRPVRRHGRAFTIVELLVVIGIVGLLLALLFPALRAIKTASRQSTEAGAAKQLMAAYVNYAAVHDDKVLPGYAGQIPVDPGPNDPVRVLRAFDAAGKSISGSGNPPLDIARKRYLWRLAPYFSYNLRGLYTNEQDELLERLEQTDYKTYLYLASIAPALGLNSEWMGGDEEYGFRPIGHIYRSVIDYNQYYLTSIAQGFHPSKLLVFASARGIDPESQSTAPVEGYFKVQSPYFAEINPACRWSENFIAGEAPVRYGYISPRYGGNVVIGFLDGHADVLTQEKIRDMRYWANWATKEDWRLPRPAPDVP